jgi:hypothetical protein
MKRIVIILLVIFCSINLSYSRDDNYYEDLYSNAKESIAQGKEDDADFYMARYMGVSLLDQDSEKNFTDLYPLFETHRVFKPTSFISGKYSESFLEWFMFISYAQWGYDDDEDIDFKNHSMVIRTEENQEYIVTISAKPFLEGWSIIKGTDTETAILALAENAQARLTKHSSGVPEKIYEAIDLCDDNGLMQTVWPIEFYDLDGDGRDEVWIRYNRAMASGFMQELAIYKITDSGLELFKKFRGMPEGITRRLGNSSIEVGYGFASEPGTTGHLGYDRYRLERWEHRDGDFVKVSETDIPHILWSDSWSKYYFSMDE